MHGPRALLLWLALSAVSGTHHTTFCVVTARRTTSYLARVLDSMLEQRATLMDGVGVIVVNVDNHTVPWPVRTGYIVLSPLERRLAVCDTQDVEGLPSCKVRQITLDVTAALTACARHTSGWVVLLEDDCVACPNAVDETVTALSGLSPGNLSFARFSRGLRGIAFPARKIQRFVAYTASRLYTHPHDITRIEDWDPPGRMYVHARNLFHHVGFVSTDDRKNNDEFRATNGIYRDDVCFQADLN